MDRGTPPIVGTPHMEVSQNRDASTNPPALSTPREDLPTKQCSEKHQQSHQRTQCPTPPAVTDGKYRSGRKSEGPLIPHSWAVAWAIHSHVVVWSLFDEFFSWQISSGPEQKPPWMFIPAIKQLALYILYKPENGRRWSHHFPQNIAILPACFAS